MIFLAAIATSFLIKNADDTLLLYQILVFMMLLFVPYDHKSIPIAFCSILPVTMIGAHLFTLYYVAPYDIGDFTQALSIINIIINCFAFLLVIRIEKLVRTFMGTFHEKKLNDLQSQAHHDSLTSLYNRRYADLYFNDENRRNLSGEHYLALIDIDDFKLINDTYGHHAGDEALRILADMFVQNSRRTDLVFRWGGEEFLIFVNDAKEEGAYKHLETIRQLVENAPITYENYTFSVSITIGMTRFVGDLHTALEECDKKMYYGKKHGKNAVIK